ncbi:MAG: MFS transporter, partial [Clostridia bacterium]
MAFISLGLPDSGMGVMWPYMRLDFGANVSLAGLITITVTVMSSISSVVCIRLSRKVNVGTITAVSSMLTAVGMLGYSISGAFWQVCVFAMLTGFGGGGVDATLNDYVAKHYSSRIMNWLHSCWGLGAMLSPIIMTGALNASGSWRSGFLIVGIAQATMAIMFFFTSKFWKKESKVAEKEELSPLAPQMTMKNLAPWLSILCFFLYCGIEMINGVWLKTLLYETRELGTNLSSAAVSVFFGAIMVGRIIIGLFSNKLGNRNAIRIGICVAMLGFVLLTIKSTILCLCAALFIGLGLAPIYPAL